MDGLHDMHETYGSGLLTGMVAVSCASADPYCDSAGSNHVKRGGYWGNTSDGVRSSP